MPADDTPKAFTDSQRELFALVAKLNHLKARHFADADRWIDTKPPTAEEERQRYRERMTEERAQRKRKKDRSWLLDVPGEMANRWRLWIPKDDAEEKEKADVLTQWRRDRAQSIRYGIRQFRKRIAREKEHGPLQPHELIDLAASRFVRTSDPLVFDAMNPRQKALWARRLLRVVWILTDTRELTATKLQWLRDWKWGEHHLEFLSTLADGKTRPIPRLWCRMTTFDPELDAWEKLTRIALHSLEEAKPGATSVPLEKPKPIAPVVKSPDDPALIALTPNEQAIFDELSETPMSALDIVAKLARQGIANLDDSALSRACKRPQMRARGVRHRRGAGYYKLPS
jgi:hypothetical protein